MSNKYPGGIITSGANAGYSVFFDGTGDYLSMSSGTSLGAGNFTIECWVYLTAAAASETTVGSSTNYYTVGFNGNFVFRVGTTNLWRSFDGQGSQATIDGSFTWSTGQWYHMAWVRNSGTVTVYRNGTSLGSVADSKTLSDSTNGYGIAATRQASSYSSLLTGYISNLRVVVGTALYTAAFTPPTQLFAITNTSLLTCNSPAIVDQSSNNFTITANGNAAVSTFTPFTGYTAYNPALGAATPGIWSVSDAIQAAQTRRWNMYDPYFNYTTLLLHGNGTNGAQNNTFLDSSSNNFTITRNNNTTQGTFSPFSQTGWSSYFSSSSFTTNTALFNSGWGTSGASTLTATIDCWVYVNALGSAPANIWWNPNVFAKGDNYMCLGVNSSGNIFFYHYDGTARSITSSNTISTNTWVYVAVTITGAVATLYINGTSVGSGTWYGIQSAGLTGAVTLGRSPNPSGQYWNGYISNFRVSSVARTISTPTAAFTSDGNTSFLTFQSNRFIDTSSNAYALTVENGTPSVQAFSPFYPLVAYTPQAQGGSGYFDGTGDYLSIADNAAFDFGSSDFTLEAFVYCTDFTPERAVLAKWTATGTANANSWYLFFNGGTAQLVTSSNGSAIDVNISGGTAYANAWNHIAASRSGNTYSLYLNGTRVATTTNANSLADVGTAVEIGRFSNGGGIYAGYISGARIVKGTAVYTGTTLTVPTAPLTAITNTSLLANFTNAGIVDSTAKNALETVSGAQISTAQSKFGGSSLLFNGSSDYLVSTAANTRNLVNFGTGDFTVECWVYFNGTGTNQGFLDSATSTSSGTSGQWFFNRTSAGNLQYGQHGVGAIISAAWSVSTGVWYHIAICRASGQSRLFANGVQLGSTTSDTVNYNNAGSLQVGVNATPYWMNGYIDEIRISRYARYTGNFTPQTSQWQDQ